jgi:hypothetical protein
MSKIKIQSELNDIVKMFVQGSVPAGSKIGSRTFGISPESAISVLGENVDSFTDALERLRDSRPQVRESLSLKELLDRLIPLIREKVLACGEVTPEEAKKFEDEITNLPLYKFRVVRRIFGVMLAPGSPSIRFGKFVIGFGNQLFGDEARKPFLALTLKPEELNEVYIDCTVEARDTERAKEIANLRFYSFEQIFRVLIGRRTDRLEVGILNYTGPQLRDCFVLAVDGPMAHNSSWNGALQPVPLDDLYFSKPQAPFPRLFELISGENTELERHILRCAEWTGQAMGDQNGASAFVKGAIALEVLFSANEKGVITPSIMAQIAESCAFLLGNSKWQPWEVEKEVKRLYGIRSAVVHSGKNSVEEEDLNSLLQICRTVVIVLFSNPDFAQIASISQIADYFRRRRYAKVLETQPREEIRQ